MKKLAYMALCLAGAGAGHAGDLDVRVLLSGEVAPGVYGQVNIGNGRPPPLVYAQPVLIEPRDAPPPPVYLHVPPGHAKHWRQHCHEYHACDRPVYFVRSAEYEPNFTRRGYDEERARREQWEREQERARLEMQQSERMREHELEERDRERGREADRDHDHDHDRDGRERRSDRDEDHDH